MFKGIPDEKELRVVMLKLIAAFFILGLVVEKIFFPGVGNWPLFIAYVASDLMLPVAYLLFRMGRIDDNRALIMQALAVSVAQCADMVMQVVAPEPGAEVILMASVCMMVVPVVAAGLTTWRWLPFILSGLCMLLYGAGAWVSGERVLSNMFVSLAFLLAGLSVLQRIIMDAWRDADRTRKRVAEQNTLISRFFHLTPGEFELITKGKMTRQQAAGLLERSDKQMSTALIERIKDVIQTEDAVRHAIRMVHPRLTDKDLQLCCHIAEGLSAADIARVGSIAISSVTAHRSRLRTKLGLHNGESLRDYITTLVHRAEGRNQPTL